MGSGSTGVASVKLNRKFIGMESDEKYFKIAEDRIQNTTVDIDSMMV
jgi:site-specific DNA-methyltransferase (adenine-specific)